MFVQHIISQALAVYINNQNLKDDDFEQQANKQKAKTKQKNLQLILTAAL